MSVCVCLGLRVKSGEQPQFVDPLKNVQASSGQDAVFVCYLSATPPPTVLQVLIRDGHGNGIPNGNGNPVGIPWEWELVTKLGMGRNGNVKSHSRPSLHHTHRLGSKFAGLRTTLLTMPSLV